MATDVLHTSLLLLIDRCASVQLMTAVKAWPWSFHLIYTTTGNVHFGGERSPDRVKGFDHTCIFKRFTLALVHTCILISNNSVQHRCNFSLYLQLRSNETFNANSPAYPLHFAVAYNLFLCLLMIGFKK